jgi:peptidase M48-like protein
VRGKNAAGAILIGLVIGLLLMAIGWIGVFFGRLIKSAVSRQREFLADASSVQFTRNPTGITGALKKIGGMLGGSRLENAKAEEASHLFFSNGVKSSFLGLLSTHPPLEERIRRFDPQFEGRFDPVLEMESGALEELAVSGFHPSAHPPPLPFAPEQVVARAGTVQPEQLAYAIQLVAALSDALRDAVHNPQGAQAVVYSLLLDTDENVRQSQRGVLAQSADPAVFTQIDPLTPEISQLGAEARLPLVDMAMPALRLLTADQYKNFRDNICVLVEADQQIRLFEFTLNRILLRHLDPVYFGKPKKVVQYYSLDPLRAECSILLSALAHVGAGDAQSCFAAGVPLLGAAADLLPLEQCDLGSIDSALDKLNGVSAPLKKRLLEASAACVSFDGQVTIEEAELFRAVADALDCPMPPFLAAA